MATTNCQSCQRPVTSPWRVYNEDGSIRFGCVDAFHDGAVVTKNAAWHARIEARRIRKRAASFRKVAR